MGLDSSKRDLLMKHYSQLCETFSGLGLNENEDGRFTIAGNLGFTVTHDGKTVEDDYDIEIIVPTDYPDNHPTVKETGNRIPRDKDNHVYPTNGTLCLGAPLAVKRTFAKQRNLLWFVKEQVVPFLFSHSYKQEYGVMPFGELRHGSEGILDYYKELFSVKDDWIVLGLLKILADDNYKGHTLCPCGSNQKLRHCHGDLLRDVKEYQNKDSYLAEYVGIFKLLNKQGKKQSLTEYMPNSVLKSVRKHKRKLNLKKRK